MNSLPAFIAVVPGVFIGFFCVRILVHWLALLYTALGSQAPGSTNNVGRIWATVFTVLHPAPWLMAFGAYKLISQPPTGAWRWFFAGAACSLIGSFAGGFYVVHKARMQTIAKKSSDEPVSKD